MSSASAVTFCLPLAVSASQPAAPTPGGDVAYHVVTVGNPVTKWRLNSK